MSGILSSERRSTIERLMKCASGSTRAIVGAYQLNLNCDETNQKVQGTPLLSRVALGR